MLDVPAYLDRIRYIGSTTPTLESFRAIHHAHMLAVPFENLDIGLGRKIVIDEEAFVRKVVERRRGGFCYELNGAFAALLRALGFQVTLLSARVARSDGGESPEFDHLTLRMNLRADPDEPWLADVGFGDSFLEPLQLRTGIDQRDPAGTFRLVQTGDRLHLEKLDPKTLAAEKLDSEKADPGGGWNRQYSFTLQPRHLEEFSGMCHYHQTSPESHFVQNQICSLATPEERITLSGMKLIVTRNGRREERLLESGQEWRGALNEHFGIVL